MVESYVYVLRTVWLSHHFSGNFHKMKCASQKEERFLYMSSSQNFWDRTSFCVKWQKNLNSFLILKVKIENFKYDLAKTFEMVFL